MKLNNNTEVTIVYRKNRTQIRIELQSCDIIEIMHDIYNNDKNAFVVQRNYGGVMCLIIYVPVDNRKDIDSTIKIWRCHVKKAQKEFSKIYQKEQSVLSSRTAKRNLLKGFLQLSVEETE